MPYIDFNEVKKQVSIEVAVQRLGFKTTKSGHQLRAACPACKQGGDRALAITPQKSLFYCFAAQVGGDQIALTAHIREIGAKEAAEWLVGTVQNSSVSSTSTSTVSKNDANASLPPLEYLEYEHQAVEALGFDPAVARFLGIGYAGKGLMKGTVAIPIRLMDGTISGYIGITEAKLPGKWRGIPESNIVRLKTA